MKFCSKCGHTLTIDTPPDDHIPRHICTNCGTIHYQNPNIIVCTIPVWEQDGNTKILLCRRAIEPRYDYWTLPGGFMENAETTDEAAARETMEEAGARIELLPLFSLINLPAMHQVHLFYRARLLDLNFAPGTESLEVRLFSEDEIPWNRIAFSTVRHAMQFFFSDLAKIKADGTYDFHSHDIFDPKYNID